MSLFGAFASSPQVQQPEKKTLCEDVDRLAKAVGEHKAALEKAMAAVTSAREAVTQLSRKGPAPQGGAKRTVLDEEDSRADLLACAENELASRLKLLRFHRNLYRQMHARMLKVQTELEIRVATESASEFVDCADVGKEVETSVVVTTSE